MFDGFVLYAHYTIDNQLRMAQLNQRAREVSVWRANALMFALEDDRPAALDLLLSARPALLHEPCLYRKAQHVLAFTPLLVALYRGDAALIAALLRRGADPRHCPAVTCYVPVLQSVLYTESDPPGPDPPADADADAVGAGDGPGVAPSSPAAPPAVSLLPSDVFACVLRFLDAHSLRCASAVCSAWYPPATDNAVWRALGAATLRGFRDFCAAGPEEGPGGGAPAAGVRNFKTLFRYFALRVSERRLWNFAYQWATSPARLLEPRLGRAARGHKAYAWGGLLGAEFLHDFARFPAGHHTRLWNELPPPARPGGGFEPHRRRAAALEALLLRHPDLCRPDANRMFVTEFRGPAHFAATSPLAALLQSPGRSEAAVLRLLDLGADPALGAGVWHVPGPDPPALPPPPPAFAGGESDDAEPYVRPPAEPPGGVWRRRPDGVYEVSVAGAAYARMRWTLLPFEAALEWGSLAVFRRVFPPAHARWAPDPRVAPATLLAAAARRGHAALFRWLQQFFAAAAPAPPPALLRDAVAGAALALVARALRPPPPAADVAAALRRAARLPSAAVFLLLWRRFGAGVGPTERHALLCTACVAGRAPQARVLAAALPPAALGLCPEGTALSPLAIAAAQGHVHVLVALLRRADPLALWTPQSDAPPPDDPVPPLAMRCGVPTCDAGARAPGGARAPAALYLASMKMRAAVARLLPGLWRARGLPAPPPALPPAVAPFGLVPLDPSLPPPLAAELAELRARLACGGLAPWAPEVEAVVVVARGPEGPVVVDALMARGRRPPSPDLREAAAPAAGLERLAPEPVADPPDGDTEGVTFLSLPLRPFWEPEPPPAPPPPAPARAPRYRSAHRALSLRALVLPDAAAGARAVVAWEAPALEVRNGVMAAGAVATGEGPTPPEEWEVPGDWAGAVVVVQDREGGVVGVWDGPTGRALRAGPGVQVQALGGGVGLGCLTAAEVGALALGLLAGAEGPRTRPLRPPWPALVGVGPV